MARDEFRPKIKRELAKRVNYLCSNPECRNLTSGPHSEPDKSICLGRAAHITAASILGPRYDKNLTPEQRSNIDNGIWLCANCADLIDKDEIRYPESLVRNWRTITEKYIMAILDGKNIFNTGTNENANVIMKCFQEDELTEMCYNLRYERYSEIQKSFAPEKYVEVIFREGEFIKNNFDNSDTYWQSYFLYAGKYNRDEQFHIVCSLLDYVNELIYYQIEAIDNIQSVPKSKKEKLEIIYPYRVKKEKFEMILGILTMRAKEININRQLN